MAEFLNNVIIRGSCNSKEYVGTGPLYNSSRQSHPCLSYLRVLLDICLHILIKQYEVHEVKNSAEFIGLA